MKKICTLAIFISILWSLCYWNGLCQAASCPTKTLKTLSITGRLQLKGPTAKDKFLIEVQSGKIQHIVKVVTTKPELIKYLGHNGAMPQNGDPVRVVYNVKQFGSQDFCFKANFLTSGFNYKYPPVQSTEEDFGQLTDFKNAFQNKTQIKAYACKGSPKKNKTGARDYEAIKQACNKADNKRYLLLNVDGKGYYTTNSGASKQDLEWYPNEFDAGIVNIAIEEALHEYSVYNEQYLEGYQGPSEDGLPPLLIVK